MAEDPRSEHDEADADDGQDDDEGQARALRAHAPQQALGRRTEVHRLLERHRRRAMRPLANPPRSRRGGRTFSSDEPLGEAVVAHWCTIQP